MKHYPLWKGEKRYGCILRLNLDETILLLFTSVRRWASENIAQGISNTKLNLNLSIIHVHNAP